jgi:4-hydroxy-tetrahydrodipicolinate reductase
MGRLLRGDPDEDGHGRPWRIDATAGGGPVSVTQNPPALAPVGSGLACRAMTIPVIMHGAAGRMGRSILGLLADDPAFTVVAGVDRQAGSLRDLGIASDAPIVTALPAQPGAVIIDFSNATVVPSVVAHAVRLGMPLAIGTTGVDPARQSELLAEARGRIPVLWAANMSLGVNLMIALAGKMAKALGQDYDIEIVEAHHHHKVDAPSGTALAVADSILASTGRTRADLVHGRNGHTGPRRPGEIGMHALRMGDVVGDHQVYYVSEGERIYLGHQAHTREIFAQGAVRAARFLATAAPGRWTMADVLGLDG